MAEDSINVLRAERDRLACALAERSAQVEANSKEFEQFTQILCHDLRAPLRALEGFSQILIDDYRDNLGAEGKQCVEILASSARKASALIEDLHAFWRLCRKPLNPAVVDMRRLAEQKAGELRNEGNEVEFRIEAMPEAWGDPELLGSVLEELLRNAVKFSSRQAHPCVEVRGRSENRRAVYCVQDNGAGFDPKFASRLFAVFQRLHDEKDFPGRGIGLATVQRLVHRHGGEVWAEGKANNGAAFSFSLPTRPL